MRSGGGYLRDLAGRGAMASLMPPAVTFRPQPPVPLHTPAAERHPAPARLPDLPRQAPLTDAPAAMRTLRPTDRAEDGWATAPKAAAHDSRAADILTTVLHDQPTLPPPALRSDTAALAEPDPRRPAPPAVGAPPPRGMPEQRRLASAPVPLALQPERFATPDPGSPAPPVSAPQPHPEAAAPRAIPSPPAAPARLATAAPQAGPAAPSPVKHAATAARPNPGAPIPMSMSMSMSMPVPDAPPAGPARAAAASFGTGATGGVTIGTVEVRLTAPAPSAPAPPPFRRPAPTRLARPFPIFGLAQG
jgi:hypothetical protein